jgi:hypothetical protein
MPPFLTNKGTRLVYPTGQDLAWLDLATGQQGRWQLSVFGPSNYAQLTDTIVAFDVYSREGGGATTQLLDTEKGTIAPARDATERGQVAPLSPRPGLVRRNPNVVALVTALEAGEPQDVDRAIGEMLTAREIAKLNDPYRSDFGAPNSGRTPEERAMLERLARQARAQPAPPLVGKTVLSVPADAKVAMLGVYQAAGSSKSPTHSGNVTVLVGPGKEPLVLVLSSYEKVNWMVQAGNRKIAAVLLSGYNPSTVYGQGQAEVVRIGGRHAYKIDSPDFQELRREVARYVGPATPVFQGSYEGSLFQVQ